MSLLKRLTSDLSKLSYLVDFLSSWVIFSLFIVKIYIILILEINYKKSLFTFFNVCPGLHHGAVCVRVLLLQFW